MTGQEETICAPATALGGALAVIRMSGPMSLSISSEIFTPSDRNTRIDDQKGYTLIYGDIKDGEEIVDDVLLSIFRSPHSYTGEDSIEISCHASPYIVKKILELLISKGAVSAKPGEFTRRAFINGKMDLSQAESVADIIASETRMSHKLAISQMRGGFSAEISELRNGLLKFASLIELELDFGEEDVEFANRNELRSVITEVRSLAVRLADSFRLGNAIKNGIPVTIVGKPNSGKSTLLNALLNEEKAIVSEIPGTTRDTIEDTIVIDGVEYRFIDTAGLHETTDIIESLGIKRTYDKIKQATVILFTDEINDDPVFINQRVSAIRESVQDSGGKQIMIIINKTDLGTKQREEDLQRKIVVEKDEKLLFISAREKKGIEELRQQLGNIILRENLNSSDVIVTNVRHYEALLRVSESLRRVLHGLDNNIPDDIITIDIRQAIHYLGEITGIITTDEILGNIFKNFCIGK